jgi:hypothetical protein
MFNMQQKINMPMMPFMPARPKLAEAYVPYQRYTISYRPEEALEKGTMFPELYDPYEIKMYEGEKYYDYR